MLHKSWRRQIQRARSSVGLLEVMMVAYLMLIENGNISPSMTAGDVRTKYTMFAKYSYSCFASALSNSRKSFATHIKARGTPDSKYICVCIIRR